jgi:hypothetical protein
MGGMDPISLAAGLVSAQMGAVQMAAAARLMKTNIASAGAVTQVIEAAQQNVNRLANVAAHIGRNLDISV